MPVLGITGGIATGKSSFLRTLLKHRPADFFDADRCVHELLASDAELYASLRQEFGTSIFTPAGELDRAALRQIVFADDAARTRLESLIHPKVRERWSAQVATARADDRWLYVDIPLLYETATADAFDRVIVVACSPATQRQRLESERGLAPELIARMIKAQLDLAIKVARADHVVWNDSTPAVLEEQVRLLVAWLRKYYG